MNGEAVEVRAEKVSRSFGAVKALSGVDADFSKGVIHGIIGPNGAGKTTLLRLVTGLLKPSGGTLRYFAGGKAVPFSSVKPLIAYFPQEQSLYGDLSIDEHLEFFRSLYALPEQHYRERRAELLALTRLEEFAGRKAGRLSGGMYKKLGLMCVLLSSPAVLVLDEPTIGVDPVSRRELWSLVYRLAAEGMLILISTSYMDEAERCGRVHLLEGGRLLASGEPRAVLREQGADNFERVFLKIAERGGGL